MNEMCFVENTFWTPNPSRETKSFMAMDIMIRFASFTFFAVKNRNPTATFRLTNGEKRVWIAQRRVPPVVEGYLDDM